jgi:hypothetical protein
VSTTFYRVINNGLHIQTVEHVKSAKNGWHTYRVVGSDPMAGLEFKTREWYPNPTPLGAILDKIATVSNRMMWACRTTAGPVCDLPARERIVAENDEDAKAIRAMLIQAQMLCAEAGLLRSKP